MITALAARLFAQRLPIDEALDAVAAAAREGLGADRATCYTISADGLVASVRTTEQDRQRRAIILDTLGRDPAGMPVWHLLVATQDSVLAIADVAGSGLLPPRLAAAVGAGAILGVRLTHPEEPGDLGSLFVSWRAPRSIGEREREGMMALAGLAAPALAAARLHAQAVAALDRARRDEAAAARAHRMAGLGTWAWDVVTGELEWSEVAYRLMGVDPGARPDFQSFLACLHPDDREMVRARCTEVAVTGEPLSFRLRILRGDGTERVVASAGEADRHDLDGRPLHYTGAAQDITDRVREEERLRRESESLSRIARIRSALDEGRLTLHAQPIVEVVSGLVVQHELLVRMFDERGRLVGPGDFLPAAEEHGLIREIDRWAIARAVALAARGHDVNLNLSAASLGDPGLAGYLAGEIVSSGADPVRIVVELTETALIDSESDARDFVQRARGLGCRVALDDFGTGYGSFLDLKRLPVDYLKIDIEFIRDLVTNPASRHVVEAVVTLARAFGQKTVAEGVEDVQTLTMLEEMGVDLVQGYWLGRPGPAEEMLEAARSAARALARMNEKEQFQARRASIP